jgi:hypothetical protein
VLGEEDRSVSDSFSLGKNVVVAAPRFEGDQQTIATAWPPAADHLDLLEPFTRIREALEEAQQAGRRAA